VPESLAFEITVGGTAREHTLTVELAEKPATSVFRMALPRYLVEGEGIFARTETPPGQAEGDASGAWIVVFASQLLPVDRELATRFRDDPDGALGEVSAAFEHVARADLRPVADLCAGVFALALLGTRPALWNEAAVFWHDETKYKATSSTPPSEFLQPSAFGKRQLLEMASSVAAAMGAPARMRTVIQLCARWLVISHGLPIGSNERFVTTFQCIEALCNVVGNEPTSEDATGFELLDGLLAGHRSENEEQARAFLQSVRERLARPSLNVRFGRLAATYGGTCASDDVKKFRAIAKARNELLHARVAEVPSLKNGVEVHKAAYDIAARYLAAIIEHARVASPPKMISTTGFDESKA
jgi:hypothetical protein